MQAVGVDREVGGHGEVRRHARVGAAGGPHAIRPVDEVVAGQRAGGHRGAVAVVVDRLGRDAGERAACSRGVVQPVGLLRRGVNRPPGPSIAWQALLSKFSKACGA